MSKACADYVRKIHRKAYCSDPLVAKLRGGSRTAETSKMESFVIIANGFQLLTIITKCSILDVAAVLDPSLKLLVYLKNVKL